MQQDKKLLFGTIGVAILVFVGLVWALVSAPSSNGPGPVGSELSFEDSGDPSVGPEDAKVVVRLFSDLQCPACRAVEAGLSYAIDKYKDRVRFVWNDFPLLQIHPNARLAANAARCAEAQEKFWEYKDLLFREQDSWGSDRQAIDAFKVYAGQLGLKGDEFNTCLDNRTFDSKVMADVAEGNRNRVDRTPTIFINSSRQFGVTQAELDQLLAAALKQVEASESP